MNELVFIFFIMMKHIIQWNTDVLDRCFFSSWDFSLIMCSLNSQKIKQHKQNKQTSKDLAPIHFQIQVRTSERFRGSGTTKNICIK